MVSIFSVMLESLCATYHPISTIIIPTGFQHVLMYVGNRGVSIYNQLNLRVES